MRLASFREIGNNLKEKFDKASRVRVSNDFRGITRNKYKYKKSVQLETYEKGECVSFQKIYSRWVLFLF